MGLSRPSRGSCGHQSGPPPESVQVAALGHVARHSHRVMGYRFGSAGRAIQGQAESVVRLTTVRCKSKVSTHKGAEQLHFPRGIRTLAIHLLVRLLVRRCRVVGAGSNIIAAVLVGQRHIGGRGILRGLVANGRQTSPPILRDGSGLLAIVTSLGIVLALSLSRSLLFLLTRLALSLFGLLSSLPFLANFLEFCARNQSVSKGSLTRAHRKHRPESPFRGHRSA